ncbi:ABC transporter permease [Capillibacterium thermochitinicola]|uniref:ABC transporter permease n=1 Tax=Capillibacterium thermochitinicola TaxID=2699427 RepID=A0A8J6I325_9FIRM|nr:ABC transporter permease [Capillibacterium thermochitinicola]MBA2133357.1 ABC transporter permease [Capillibacterium thermochitinicola]
MNKRAAKAIITKDIKAISSNIQLWLPMIVVPLFFSLVLPLVLVLPARFTDLSAIGNSDVIMRLFSQLPPGRLRETIFAFPAVQQQIVYFTVNYLFAPFFLLIPLMTASVIGANSFAGEKERKTLETLLFAPLDLNTLFWAKILAAFLPATLLTLICSFLYGIVVNITAYPLFGRLIFPEGNWLLLLLWVSPALSLGTVFVNVFISAKVKGFQEAFQLSGLVILPILGLFIGQLFGILLVSSVFLWWFGAALWFINFLLLKKCGRFLNRDQLFTSQVS